MAKLFTLSEAEQLLPVIRPALEQAIRAKAEYQHAEAALENAGRRVTMAGGMLLDRTQLAEDRQRKDRSARLLKDSLETIQDLGCLVKDLDMGLIDFPTLFRGEEVYLCWRLGENGIEFWHGIHEGFRGRKRIDEDFIQHHRGDQPQ